MNNNTSNEGQSKSKILTKKKLLLGALCLLIFSIAIFVVGKYYFTPWRNYPGQLCSFRNCQDSDVIKKNACWKDLAIQTKNPDLCDRSEEYLEGGDVLVSKEYASELCKINYAIQLGDVNFCNTFPNYSKITCLGGIALKLNRNDLLTKEDCRKYPQNFNDCVNLLVKINKDESYCQMLADNKAWLGEQMCRQYADIEEKRNDTVRQDINDNNIDELTLICNNYKKLENRASCYLDIRGGLFYKEGTSGWYALDNYCADRPLDDSWSVCLYLEEIGYVGGNQWIRVDEIKNKIFEAASTDDNWKIKFCESIRWNTYGSKGIFDVDIKNFGLKQCGFDYLK